MTEQQKDKNQVAAGPVKPFMTAGPGLHYSHSNVTSCWLLALAVYVLACLFWSNILAGSFMSFELRALLDPGQWRLERFSLDPLSIYEYPWQIIVLGLLMGMLSVMPPLTAQLLSFRYSLPYIAILAFLADLPLFAVAVLISCIASSCRPLRFRSRFIALSLCMAPQLFYWAYFGGVRNVDPIKWGFSFAPWVCAWLIALIFAGIAILIGHFTRYRPGLNLLMGSITLITALLVFHNKIGFDELAYQQYISKNNPDDIIEFRDHNLKPALDATLANPASKRYFASFSYPSDPVSLRDKIKRETLAQLNHDKWPSWFVISDELNFPAKRMWVLGQYDLFIKKPRPWWLPEPVFKMFEHRRLRSKRMPAALYYKAVISETVPDQTLIMDKELLHFYSEYPHWSNLQIWYELYTAFPQSAESIEARRRVAMHMASQGRFEQADAMVREAQTMVQAQLAQADQPQAAGTGLLTAFTAPQSTAITTFKLIELQRQLDQLHSLIGAANLPAYAASRERLEDFLLLDPHSLGYSAALDNLLSKMPEDDPLRDNVLLAKALLIKDWQIRAQELRSLFEKYRNTEGGTAALFELGILKVRMWQELGAAAKPELKRRALNDARETLGSFLALYPKSVFTTQVQNILHELPRQTD